MSHDRNYFDDTSIVLTNETEFRRRAVPKQEFGNEGKGGPESLKGGTLRKSFLFSSVLSSRGSLFWKKKLGSGQGA
jgi:hypothetical protein